MKSDRKAVNIPAKELHPFEGNPYKVQNGEEMDVLIESIKLQGILTPLIVRPMADRARGYEVISGHRRLAACQRLEMTSIPVIVQQMDDDKAMIAVVDANLQREHILPSEKAYAFKMKLEALSHQGITSAQVEQKLSRDAVANDVGMSGAQVQRYIRLTHLIPELLNMVDEGKIAFTPAVELSYLTEEQQNTLLSAMALNDCTPSHAQSIRMKKLAQQGSLSSDGIYEIMSEVKANQQEHIRFKVSDLQGFFPKDYTVKQMTDTILKLLQDNRQRLERRRSGRDER